MMPELAFDPTSDLTQEVMSFEVEYEDVFQLQNLYEQALEWMRKNEFTSTDVGDKEVETLYHHKVNQDGGVEHRIWLRASRTPDTSYFKYFLKVDFRTINLSTVQLSRDGEQVKANKGDVIIRVSSYLLLDAEQNWQGSTFGVWFHEYFRKRMYRDRINQEQERLWNLTKDFQATLKHFLELKHPQPKQDQFHPKYRV
jgi:hypothetical protein